MKKLLTIVLVILAMIFVLTQPVPVLAADTGNGAQIFEINCAGCHPNGSNIIRRGKNLKQKALKKYKMESVEAIASIVTNGKSLMSAYKDRLTEGEIKEVATYVLERAEKDWK